MIIDDKVAVYAEESLTSEVIDYLSYNIIRDNTDWYYGTGEETRAKRWDSDFTKIQSQSGSIGYIEKKYIKSPIDYRFGFSLNEEGEWKMIFLVTGD